MGAADIVIPVHNSPEDVRRCLSACRATLREGDPEAPRDPGPAWMARRMARAGVPE